MGLRGHGDSGKQAHNWALPQAARDVRALLEQLDLHDVMLAAMTGRSGAAPTYPAPILFGQTSKPVG